MDEKNDEHIDFSAMFKDAKRVSHDKYVPKKNSKNASQALNQQQQRLALAKKRAQAGLHESRQQGASFAL